MTDRILAIIRNKNMTPSQFADETGIQRSTLSHLIAGRNKPSLEVVQRIISRFPDVDISWLITGKENAHLPAGEEMGQKQLQHPFQPGNEAPAPESEKIEIQESRIEKKKKNTSVQGKQVERILFIYSDKTFSEYFPG